MDLSESTYRRKVLKTIGAGVVGGAMLTRSVGAKEPCMLDECTQEFLLAAPAFPGIDAHWDGETIVENKPLVKLGAGVEATHPETGETIVVPFAFDPVVTCVQAGTTVRWEWLNPTAVNPDFAHPIPHNVDIFQYSEEGTCSYEPDSFVSSGHPVAFKPPEEEEPKSFEHTFDEAGVYPYYCEPHGWPALPGLPEEATEHAHGPPNPFGMRGAVIVTEKRGQGRR